MLTYTWWIQRKRAKTDHVQYSAEGTCQKVLPRVTYLFFKSIFPTNFAKWLLKCAAEILQSSPNSVAEILWPSTTSATEICRHDEWSYVILNHRETVTEIQCVNLRRSQIFVSNSELDWQDIAHMLYLHPKIFAPSAPGILEKNFIKNPMGSFTVSRGGQSSRDVPLINLTSWRSPYKQEDTWPVWAISQTTKTNPTQQPRRYHDSFFRSGWKNNRGHFGVPDRNRKYDLRKANRTLQTLIRSLPGKF